ncbi:hypothetical protein BIW11_03850 [Tropilaelaps mercedesae]|uniref:Uncharacterized protein n=1 Tax=Tropilaelaps mercedesae TaxID=418985 RepID=A0A1V9XF77_9ACAR|nr:hypothetical protein BIW11_03850 [Tropilaelaps mercedesae]
MVNDRGESVLSYYEFLQHLRNLANIHPTAAGKGGGRGVYKPLENVGPVRRQILIVFFLDFERGKMVKMGPDVIDSQTKPLVIKRWKNSDAIGAPGRRQLSWRIYSSSHPVSNRSSIVRDKYTFGEVHEVQCRLPDDGNPVSLRNHFSEMLPMLDRV